MGKTSVDNSNGPNERSFLINGDANGRSSSSRQESLSRRASALLNESTKKQRFRAIRICYFGIFVSSIVFSITISSLWPFLQIVDKTAEATFLGWLVAGFSLGQLIASPIIGYIANRTNNNKMPLVISTLLIVLSNIIYAYVQSINTNGLSAKWWLMLSRFIMGIGAANSTIMRSYSSSATTLAERTNVMANLSAYQGLGFILGPLLQALFAFMGYPGPVHSPALYLNIYTAPAFFSAFTAFVNFLLFLLAFEDIRIVSTQRISIDASGTTSIRDTNDEDKGDLRAVISCLYLFFVAYLTFTNYETIASPLSIDMYAWTKEQSTAYNGYILGALGAMSIVILIITKILTKRFQDRTLLLAGMIICFLGYFVFLPWGSDYPSLQIPTYTPRPPDTTTPMSENTTISALFLGNVGTTAVSPGNSTSDPIGCPFLYDWCYYVPRVKLGQYIMASVIITSGFTVGNVICYSIYSKKLGERPQGTMMGIFTSAGSLARTVGPIAVGFLYKHWGPRVMMIFMLVVVFTAIIVVFRNFKCLYIPREVPEEFDDDDEEEKKNEPDGNDEENTIDATQDNRFTSINDSD